MKNVGIITDFGTKLDSSDLRDPEQAKAIKTVALSFEEEDDRAWASAQVAEKLADAGRFEEAERLAETITLPYEKANAFVNIARRLLEAKDVSTALRNLANAEVAATMGKANWIWQTAENYARIGQTMAHAGNHSEALRVWDKAIEVGRTGEEVPTHDSEECSGVLWQVAEYLALAGELEKAKSLASSIRTDRKRDHAVTAVARIASGDKNAGRKWD